MEVLIALEHLLDSNWVYANMALPGGNSFCTLRTKHANDHLPAVVNPILSIEKALLPFGTQTQRSQYNVCPWAQPAPTTFHHLTQEQNDLNALFALLWGIPPYFIWLWAPFCQLTEPTGLDPCMWMYC